MSTKLRFFFILIVLLCSFLIFKGILDYEIPTDMQAHIYILRRYLSQGMFPVPPLYYLLIYTLSGFNANIFWLNQVSILLLSMAVLAKYLFSFRYLKTQLQQYKTSDLELVLLSSSLLLLFPVWYDWIHFRMYLGKLATNVWHNSTTILLMPFVVLLFQASLNFIKEEKPTYRQSIWIITLCVVQVLIKPSFLFVFVPIFPLFVLLRSGIYHTKTWLSVGIAGFIFLMILIEYYIIYQLNTLKIIYQGDTAGIGFAFLKVIKAHSANLPADMLASMFFPLVYACLFFKTLLRELTIRYSIALFLLACLIGFCLVETGERLEHGNFMWQIFITNYLLFMAIAVDSIKKIKILGYQHYKSILLIISYLLHLLSGIVYLWKLFYFQNFD